MIEKKTMGYVDFLYPNNEAKAVSVIFNSETGKVEIYRPCEDEEWYEPNEHEHFYPTVDEAIVALEMHKKYLHDQMKRAKQYIKAMNNWLGEEKEDSPLYFTEDDYLPYDNRRTNSNVKYYREECYREVKKNKILCNIIRTGFININGETFKKEDVESIKWGKEKAAVILVNKHIVQTYDEAEFGVICLLFGDNYSRRAYSL